MSTVCLIHSFAAVPSPPRQSKDHVNGSTNERPCPSNVQNLAQLRTALQSVDTVKLEQDMCQTGMQGIGISVGLRSHVENLYVSLNLLRNTWKSSLPVIAFHWGDDLPPEVKKHMQQKFMNVNFVDTQHLHQKLMAGCEDHNYKPHEFALKAISVYHARNFFEHMLWMDSESFLLAPPEPLFRHVSYEAHGSLFWPGFFAGGVKPELYAALTDGKHAPHELADAESGQFLINTCKHNDVLEYLRVLTQHSDVTYSFMFGDKDSYRLAFAVAGKLSSYYQVSTPPSSAYATVEGNSILEDLLGHKATVARAEAAKEGNGAALSDGHCQSSPPAFLLGMLQISPEGRRLQFYHRTNAEFTSAHRTQVQADFTVPPLGNADARRLIWQLPSLGWAVCPEYIKHRLDLPQELSVVEHVATETLQVMKHEQQTSQVSGLASVLNGLPSELVRTIQYLKANPVSQTRSLTQARSSSRAGFDGTARKSSSESQTELRQMGNFRRSSDGNPKCNLVCVCGMWCVICGVWHVVCGMWHVVCAALPLYTPLYHSPPFCAPLFPPLPIVTPIHPSLPISIPRYPSLPFPIPLYHVPPFSTPLDPSLLISTPFYPSLPLSTTRYPLCSQQYN